MALQSQLDAKSGSFAQNVQAMQTLVNDLKQKIAHIQKGGGKAARERHQQHGKLLPRERIELLLDPGSEFLELSALAGFELYEDDIPAAGIITGIGRIHD